VSEKLTTKSPSGGALEVVPVTELGSEPMNACLPHRSGAVPNRSLTNAPPACFRQFGKLRCFRIMPLIGLRRTTKSGTMQLISSAEISDLYLPALEFSLTDGANTLIIKRLPFPETISSPQNRESIIERDVRDHNYQTLCSPGRIRQSGGWMIQ
jgi:hypothetical protein